MNKKVLVAMSGGVDSSVAAYLLTKQNYNCIGVTMKLFNNDDVGVSKEKACCSLEDVEDARSVAFKLNMPYYVFNFKDDFDEKVIKRFINAYENGLTPNPCIDCNRYIKFEKLYLRSKQIEFDYIATGHYVRIEKDNSTNRYLLKKGVDETKDQSYVLYSMTQDQLAHTLFPLGGMTKSEVRQIAQEQELRNANKHESQDICFVVDGDYKKFIENYTNKVYPPGDFIDENGNVLGEHKGLISYTTGQRKGLGIAHEKPLYVKSKNIPKNTVTLSEENGLYSTTFYVDNLNWIAFDILTQPIKVKAKVRYRQIEQPATIYPHDEKTVKVIFDEPQRAITSGQAAVFYDGEIVVGGGTICQVE